MKKTIKDRTTLVAAALAAHCLFVPSASVTSAAKGCPARDGTVVRNFRCNLWPSSAYSVRSRTVAASATGADKG